MTQSLEIKVVFLQKKGEKSHVKKLYEQTRYYKLT